MPFLCEVRFIREQFGSSHERVVDIDTHEAFVRGNLEGSAIVASAVALPRADRDVPNKRSREQDHVETMLFAQASKRAHVRDVLIGRDTRYGITRPAERHAVPGAKEQLSQTASTDRASGLDPARVLGIGH